MIPKMQRPSTSFYNYFRHFKFLFKYDNDEIKRSLETRSAINKLVFFSSQPHPQICFVCLVIFVAVELRSLKKTFLQDRKK